MASFVGSNPLFGCASVHKFEYFWTVTVPFKAPTLKFESPVIHTIKDSFDIAWKFAYRRDKSGDSFAVELVSIDNQEVEVFVSCYLVNILNNDYKSCVMKEKSFKYQSSINCYETCIEDSNIYEEYHSKLIKLLELDRIDSKDNIHLKFQIEFKVMEVKPHVKPKLELASNLASFRSEDVALSDVVFVVSGREFRAHRSLLAARSPVLATMLGTDMRERRSGEIHVADVEPDVFDQFLGFVYSGRADCGADCDAWTELLVVAEKYGLEDLKSLCLDAITSLFSVEGMANVLAVAYDLMSDEILKRAAVDFVARQEDSVKEGPAYRKLVEAYPFLLDEVNDFSGLVGSNAQDLSPLFSNDDR